MKQITLLADNRPGVVADISQLLADAEVNIMTIDVSGSEFEGVIFLTVDQYDTALSILGSAGYQAISEAALIIALEDKPGALAKVAVSLESANINIQSLHILRREQDKVLVSLVTDSNNEAQSLLQHVLMAAEPS
jgi:hypothetical protein